MSQAIIEMVTIEVEGVLYLGGGRVPNQPLSGCRQGKDLCMCCIPGLRFCEEHVKRSGASIIVSEDFGRSLDSMCDQCLRMNR